MIEFFTKEYHFSSYIASQLTNNTWNTITKYLHYDKVMYNLYWLFND